MEILWFALWHDFFVILPIILCSVVMIGIAINRWFFYEKNKRDIVQFISRLQRELQRGNLEQCRVLSAQLGGIVGEVSEEGLRVLEEQRDDFERSFDITIALAARKLEKGLWGIATVATISPYLGLFATVVRILLTFGELSQQGNAAATGEVMFGIGSALIATAMGLAVAIIAVFLNNFFQNRVSRYEDDFQLLKLLFLSFADREEARLAGNASLSDRNF